jgi:DNA-binding LacI/PurR family transcriptional regulator
MTTNITLGRRSREVLETLEQELGRGVHTVGATLPPERELAERFAVSRPTIRRAVAVLRQQGRIQTRHGSGMTVCAPKLTKKRSATIAVMGMFDEDRLRYFQTWLLRRGFMLCAFSVTERQFDPEVERLFLEQVRREKHHGLVAFCSPLPPVNTGLLQTLAQEGTRVLHVAPFRLTRPDQEYLLPDYEGAGRMAGERFAAAGCPAGIFVRMAEAPFEMQLERGLRKTFPGMELFLASASMRTHPPVRREAIRLLTQLPAGSGIFCRSPHLAADVLALQRECAPGKSFRVIAADDHCGESPDNHRPFDRFVFPSQPERIEQALEHLVCSDATPVHELLAPVWAAANHC